MIYEKCPTTNSINEYWKEKLVDEFPVLGNSENPHFLSLKEYLIIKPQKFYNRRAFVDYLNFLLDLFNSKSNNLKVLIDSIGTELNSAFKIIDEINSLGFHDLTLPSDTIDLNRMIDRHFHFAYLKLSEGVFHKIIYPLAYCERIRRRKNIDSLDLFNCIEEIKNSNYGYLCSCFYNTVRNGIGHGNVTFQEWDIVYKGKRGEPKSIPTRDLPMLFDNMLDYCNGIVLALKVFFLTNYETLKLEKVYMPKHIYFKELIASAQAPGWDVIDKFEFSNLKEEKQLNIYINYSLPRKRDINYFAFRTAVLTELFLNGYNRYFLSLKSKSGWPGTASFSGNKLRKNRINNSDNILDYAEAVESLMIFEPKLRIPNFFGTIRNFIIIFKLNYPILYHRSTNYRFKRKYHCRYTEAHRRKSKIVVSDASLFILPEFREEIIEIIRIKHRQIIRHALNKSRKKLNKWYAPFLRNLCIKITVYENDMRKRKFNGSGLIPNLICSITLNNSKTIQNIDFFEGIPEQIGKYRIVWNKNWTGISGVIG